VSNSETVNDIKTQSNEQLSISVTRQPHCRVKFDIQVKPEAVQAAYVKAIKNVNKEVNIPGFRKGKAPEKLIEEKFAEDIRKEWVHLVLNTAFQEAIQLTQIYPMREGETKRPIVRECSKENGASLTLEFETRPQIPSIQFEDLKVKKIDPSPITQEMRDQALQQVIRQFINYKPVEDRGIQENDFIDIDIDALEEPLRRVVENRRVQVNAKEIPNWMKEQIIGLKAGQSIESQVENKKENEEDPNFTSDIPLKITVNAIWEGEFPTVDDELAKKVGLQSLEELHKKIEDRLENEVQENAYQQQIHELEHTLLEQYPVDIPESILKQEEEARFVDYMNQLQTEEEQQYYRKHQSQIKERVSKTSEHGLQLFFLLRKVASDHGIELNEEDIKEELNRQIALIPLGKSVLNVLDKNENLRERLHAIALDRKIKEFLLDKTILI
jgi:trigger factor